ncbi:hypothetical protein GHT06_015450 [Daphnia sinensis]|uniref:Uncharacterized protein n=1 Tax=Daphnia sinensis TaxID=1820382 RepID=A0AAD5PSX9_9CRUS|nr:hypothetical protein GHT06_015450 [Daphnia sinensis]
MVSSYASTRSFFIKDASSLANGQRQKSVAQAHGALQKRLSNSERWSKEKTTRDRWKKMDPVLVQKKVE